MNRETNAANQPREERRPELIGQAGTEMISEDDFMVHGTNETELELKTRLRDEALPLLDTFDASSEANRAQIEAQQAKRDQLLAARAIPTPMKPASEAGLPELPRKQPAPPPVNEKRRLAEAEAAERRREVEAVVTEAATDRVMAELDTLNDSIDKRQDQRDEKPSANDAFEKLLAVKRRQEANQNLIKVQKEERIKQLAERVDAKLNRDRNGMEPAMMETLESIDGPAEFKGLKPTSEADRGLPHHNQPAPPPVSEKRRLAEAEETAKRQRDVEAIAAEAAAERAVSALGGLNDSIDERQDKRHQRYSADDAFNKTSGLERQREVEADLPTPRHEQPAPPPVNAKKRLVEAEAEAAMTKAATERAAKEHPEIERAKTAEAELKAAVQAVETSVEAPLSTFTQAIKDLKKASKEAIEADKEQLAAKVSAVDMTAEERRFFAEGNKTDASRENAFNPFEHGYTEENGDLMKRGHAATAEVEAVAAKAAEKIELTPERHLETVRQLVDLQVETPYLKADMEKAQVELEKSLGMDVETYDLQRLKRQLPLKLSFRLMFDRKLKTLLKTYQVTRDRWTDNQSMINAKRNFISNPVETSRAAYVKSIRDLRGGDVPEDIRPRVL
jgi:hypothetical protein